MQYLVSCLIGYLFGSIPTAFIILKKAKGIDITISGTGNVGAMNSYEVSNSKFLGILVFIVDFIKGSLSVIVVLYFVENSFDLDSHTRSQPALETLLKSHAFVVLLSSQYNLRMKQVRDQNYL